MKPRKIGKAKFNRLVEERKGWQRAVAITNVLFSSWVHIDDAPEDYYKRRSELNTLWPEGSVLDVDPDRIRQIYKEGETHFYRELRRTGIFIFWYSTEFDSSHQKRYAHLYGEHHFPSLDDYLKAVPRIQHRRKCRRGMKELMAHSRRRARRNADRLCKQWRKILDKDKLAANIGKVTSDLSNLDCKKLVGESMGNTISLRASNIEDQVLRREILEAHGNEIKPYQMQMMGRLSRMQSGQKLEGPSGDFDGE
ncbi:hypothetical protein SM033_00065 [Vibrio phage vB_VpaM_sm033]|nr:hypothetical protein SM033_00065 [Vibrio phage vB_VpaM_sm033]